MALNQNIQMAPLLCDRADHQGRNIQGLCLREECEIPPAQCYKCTLELHKECIDSTKIIDEIPNLLEPLWSMKFELLQLQQQIILHISKLVASIEQMLKPISQYVETPNLTNLNNLGVFLKPQAQIQKLEQVISGLCTQTKEIVNSIIEQVNSLVIEDSSEKQFENKSALEWNQEGIELFYQWKYEEALECYQQALKINPNYSEAWFNKGTTLFYQWKYEEALECYQQALKINPNYSEAWFNKGTTLQQQEKYEEALECYQQALKIDPNNSEAWCNKGTTLCQYEKYENALQCYEQALKINPSNFIAEQNYNSIREFLNK